VTGQPELPIGWAYSKLSEICTKPQYGWTTKAKKEGPGVKFLRTTDISSGKINWETVPFCSTLPGDLEKYLLKRGDILVSRAGSVGVSIEIEDCPRAIFGSYLIRFRALEPIQTRYVSLFLKSSKYWSQIADNTSGITIPNVNATKLQQILLPLAPLNEQRRIVARVEALLAESKTAREALDKVPVLLRRFRQSVLAKAFRGELTQRDPNDEPAQKLLQKIKQKTQTILIEEEEQPPNLPKLPEGWMWVRFGSLIESMKNGLYKPLRFYGRGIPCLRMYNIEDGKIVWKNVKEMILSEDEIEDYSLQENDILLNRVNSRELVGKAAIIPKGIDKVVFESKNIRIRVKQEFVDPRYINYFLLTRYARDQIELECKQTVGMATVSQEDIKSWFIPYTSINEQRRVVAKIEEMFSIAKQIEGAVKNAREQAERIDQAILAKAFRGELVPQDPNDEPASVLLQRLKTKTKQQTTMQTKLTN
jgi:type I restriction enzyme S subunit